MTSTQEIIQQYYDFFNAGDLERFMELLHDDVVHDINQGESQVGKDVFYHFMQRMNHSYKEKITHLVIMTNENKQHAAAEFIVEGTYLKTDSGLPTANNQTYSLAGGAFFEVKNGKISRVTNYYNLNEWLKQIGT